MKRTEYWPRQGYPLLPAVYRNAWFEDSLPSAVANKVGLPPGTTFADLDASVWNRVQRPESLRLVANYLLSIITQRLYFHSDSDAANLPVVGHELPAGATLESLPFATRTFNALAKAGKLNDLKWAADVTASEFFSLPNAGSRTLLDFATVVEQHYASTSDNVTSPSAALIDAIIRACDLVRTEFPVAAISSRDRRLKGLVGPMSIDEALDNWEARAQVSGADEISHFLKQTLELRQSLQRIATLKLDTALEDLLAHVTSDKYVGALAARWGWDGNGGCTLQEAAAVCGVTRERIRQVESSALKQVPPHAFLPALDAALEILRDGAASFEADLSSCLVTGGIATKTFRPYGVLSAARILGRTCDLELSSDGVSVHKAGAVHVAQVRSCFKSLGNVNYVASVAELQGRLQDVAIAGITDQSTRNLLTQHPQVVWLDSERQWFWLKQKEGRNRYLNAARKILAVSSRVRIDILRDGVLRHYRTKGLSLPRHAFAGLCRAAGLEVVGEFVECRKRIEIEDVLSPIESILVKILRQNENVLPLHEFRDACINEGVNRHSFYVYLTYSPTLIRLAPSIWALRGSEVDPTRVSTMLDELPAKETSLQDHGWTPDGSLWIAYKASRSLIDTGVITVPSGVNEVAGDGKFELYAVDGARVGTLSIKKSSGWGLGPFIGRRGVETGDHLIVAIDAELQMAVVHSGSGDILDAFQEGLGWGPRRLLSATPLWPAEID